ncbi:ABC transporter ATP-binding protein [Phytohabitans sp. ZYX-F-186]|uniref:ABC transporter ATP-binding protein n=1 Tax=Phytohabitans maris TaxID=3071409 RepID=A0ABU0ZHB6_9ACTN|nr:ABC transporter ATP-binding protein [Phytohabitans sp. ZYX-F-186]MDQ7906432.1 ABC transporter ATP-binding protein [Phytohabitans sp. ZYX-F-186]
MTATFGAVVRKGGAGLPVIALSALVGSGVTLALPAVLGRAIDAIVAGAAPGGWITVACGLIGLGMAAEIAGAYAAAASTAGATAWLRDRLVRHTLAIGPRRAGAFETGDLVSRVSGNAVEAAQAGPSAVAAATALLPPAGALVLLAAVDPWLAAVFLAGLVLLGAVLRAFTRHTAAAVTAYQRTQGRLAARLAESLAGIRTIAAAGTVDRERRRILEPLGALRREGADTWRVLGRSSAQAAATGPLLLVAVLATGGLALAAGRISAGDLFAASRYAAIGAGLGSLTGVLGRLARSRAGVRRAAEVLDIPTVRHGPSTVPEGPGTVEFQGVSARSDGGAPLLDGVDLVLPGGATVAVVGRSGAGKSVLAALAARLRDPDAGRVLLDGVPLPDLSRAALRTAVGCAFERPVLVGGTVADAVGLGLSRDRVRAAAYATHAHDFVSRLPEGYDTALAQAPMSGGEAQRLGLARAWHAERLLVLDDATSSVDTATEVRIAAALTGSGGGRTRLVVTHRAATAARADLVVWLAGGRVRAVGRHADLWADPEYREVFR